MTQRKAWVTAVLCLGSFMAGLDLFIVNVAFPDIRADFGGTRLSALSWVLSAYTIVFAALLVPAGRWADAFGRKRVFLTGLGLFVVASAACGAAGSVETLVALRLVQAAGAALLLPTSLALLLPEFAPERRSVVVAGWSAVSGLAAAAGPPVGGLLVEASWRWVFFVNVPIGLAALLVGLRVLTERREPDVARPDVLGALMLALGVGALVGAIVQGPTWGWGDPRVLGLFAGAVVLLGAVVVRCRTVAVPVVEPALFAVRAFTVAFGAAVVFFGAFGAMLLGAVLFLTGPWEESILTAGLQIAPGPAMVALFSLPGARLAQRIGMAPVGAVGAALFAAGALVWVIRLGDDPAYASEFLPGILLTGIGVSLVIPTITGAATAGLAPGRLATGTAVVTMGRQLGVAVGVAVLVALLPTAPTATADFDAGWTFMAAAAGVAALALAGLGRVETAGAPVAPPHERAAEVAAV